MWTPGELTDALTVASADPNKIKSNQTFTGTWFLQIADLGQTLIWNALSLKMFITISKLQELYLKD